MKNDGGPAFPVECTHLEGGELRGVQTGNTSGWAMGLTVRDYFAARAMEAQIVKLNGHGLHDEAGITYNKIAKEAYGVADAMLKARES